MTKTGLATGHTVILDATNLAMRSFHAAQPTGMAAHGHGTGPLVIFVNVLAKITAELKPTHFVACWDGGGSSHREKIFPDYKLARRIASNGSPAHADSFLLIKEFLDLTGLAQWHKLGVEADDLIAAAHLRSPGHKTILSSDKDMLQLLDAHTEQIRFTGSVVPDLWDPARVQRELGCQPEHLSAVMALSGDASDGIPGLPGIGPKRAAKMLAAVEWDWVRLLDTLSAEQRATALMCRSLVDLRDVEVIVIAPPVPPWNPYPRFEQFDVDPVREERLIKFCQKYELDVIQKRMAGGTLWW